MQRIGVDTGGTFTDVVCRDTDGRVRVYKLASTPDDPSRAILEGVRFFGDAHGQLVHGTTVATNALLERRGARVKLLVTRGFEDVLELRRQNRPYLYTQQVMLPEPLVGREDVVGVDERLDADGLTVQALTQAEIQRCVKAVEGADAVAICLLHAYANPAHEEALVRAVRLACPHAHVSASHEIVREFREFERFSTTTVNAYVGPVMATYLARLADGLGPTPIDVIQSNGGRYPLQAAAATPVNTILSGPAGGVVGAWRVAQDLGLDAIIGFDMGGTSTDVSLCRGGPAWTSESSIDGIPVRVPVIDIHTVGAGGGSVAWRDAGGALRVGPRSAGARPGPACYGNGGTELTVTDANLYLGRLPEGMPLAGSFSLDAAATRAVVEAQAGALGLDAVTLCCGVIDVANAAMVRAVKVISVERGEDPRDCALVSFGGAGGLHACALADELQIRRVVIPALPGLLSAFGMLNADELRTRSATVLVVLDSQGIARADAAIVELEADLAKDLPDGQSNCFVDCRYTGQSFELPVPWSPRPEILAASFEAAHRQAYGYAMSRAVELVNVRVVRRKPAPVGRWHVEEYPALPGAHVRLFDGFWRDAELVWRSKQMNVIGPAVIAELSATTYVPPGWVAHSQGDHLVLERT